MNHETALQRRVANLEKLIQVTRSLRSAFTLETLLHEIMNIIVELTNCAKSSILLIDPKTGELRFASASGTQFEKLKNIVVPLKGSIAGAVVENRQPVVVNNAQIDPRFFNKVDHTVKQETKTLLGVPMEIGGRVIGVLEALNKPVGEEFDEEDVQTLLMFAPQAAAAIENTRLIEEQQQRLADNAIVQDAIITLSRFIQRDRLLDQLTDTLEQDVGFTQFVIWTPEAEHDHLIPQAYCGIDKKDIPETINLDTTTAIGQAALERELINVSSIDPDSCVGPLCTSTQSLIAVPMLCGDSMVGVISVESPAPNAFSDRDRRIVFEIALQAAIGIRQAELYEASLRANKLKQEFITTMSHELRTPMTVIISACEMLHKETLGKLNDAQKSTLNISIDRANLLLRLLNDILDFSKIASGDLKLYPSLVNLPASVEAAVKRYQTYADRKNQSISIEIPTQCQHIMADGKRLRQVLEHLVDNAIKFSPENRPIVIRAELHDANFVRVDIVDQGIGIKPENQEQIFEDFRQLDNSFTREYGGAGMGLAFAKHLVELQGGIIWVESEYDRGSTFSFILPHPEPSANETTQIPISSIGSNL